MTSVYADTNPANLDPVIAEIPIIASGHSFPVSGPGAIIGNGVVIMGINPGAQLNVDYRAVPALFLPGGDPGGVGAVGLRDVTGVLHSTEDGCECEGWGVAVPIGLHAGTTGYANDSVGSAGIDVESFVGVDGGLTAVSVVSVPTTAAPILLVTHDYHPSPATANLYEVDVTVENVSGVDLDKVVYRRVMDWDIAPTAFDEFVTILGTGTTAKLIAHGDNGFLTSNPLITGPYTEPSSGDPACEAGDCVDSGPDDHGAVFDFDLGALTAGESTTFRTFYGTAPTETVALAALGAVGAEVFSLGQSNTVGGPTLGTPATFMFAFADVGGVVPPIIAVGGFDVSIDQTSLLLAGVQSVSMWMIPVILAGAGIGLFVIKRRN